MLLSRSRVGRVSNKPLLQWFCPNRRRLLTSGFDRIQEGDCAFLRYRDQEPVFTKPLHPSGRTSSRWGDIDHTSLIGKQAREVVTTSKGHEVRVYLPTLENYVKETPRLVTPIYPADANLIVSLLDIHVSDGRSATGSSPSLEILEAGTGHGALTLYLARAIHAANPAVLGEEKEVQRGAIVHSLDISSKHSEHARKMVQGFRRGMYTGDIDFHVGDVSEWIDQQISIREQERKNLQDKMFLSHIILDLPSSHNHIEKAAAALHTNGDLLVFNPNVTQINACVRLVKQKMLPIRLDRILELGPAVTGGREWDIRMVKPRVLVKEENEKKINDAATIADKISWEGLLEGTLNPKTRDEENARTTAEEDVGWEMVCRPKPWGRTIGGGFLAVWKKMKY